MLGAYSDTMSSDYNSRYKHIDDQADRLVATRWEARLWSMAFGAALVATFAMPFMVTAGAGYVILGMLATGAAALACKFQADSTATEADIIAQDILEQRSAANYAREFNVGRGYEEAREYEQAPQSSMVSAPQDAVTSNLDNVANHVTDSQPMRGDGKSWGGATRESQNIMSENTR